MTYIQKQSDGSNPFAQSINLKDNVVFASERFANVSETWLDNSYGNNGHSFTGSGYVYGTLVPWNNALLCYNLHDNTYPFTGGEYIHYPNSSRAVSDNRAINYGNTTERFFHSGGSSAGIRSNSRINIIRME